MRASAERNRAASCQPRGSGKKDSIRTPTWRISCRLQRQLRFKRVSLVASIQEMQRTSSREPHLQRIMQSVLRKWFRTRAVGEW